MFIGESAMTLGERFKEQFRAVSPIYDHASATSYSSRMSNFCIVGRDSYNVAATIKEAMCVRVNDPSFNRDIGKYHLSHIWDEVLTPQTSNLIDPSTTLGAHCTWPTPLRWAWGLRGTDRLC